MSQQSFKDLFKSALSKGLTTGKMEELRRMYNRMDAKSKRIILKKLGEMIRKSSPSSNSSKIYQGFDLAHYNFEVEKMLGDKDEENVKNAIERCIFHRTERLLACLFNKYQGSNDQLKHYIVLKCIENNCEEAVELIIDFFPKLSNEEMSSFLKRIGQFRLKRDLISKFLIDLLEKKKHLEEVFNSLVLVADDVAIDYLIVKMYSTTGVFREKCLDVLKVIDYNRFGNQDSIQLFNTFPDEVKKEILISLYNAMLDDFDNQENILNEMKIYYSMFNTSDSPVIATIRILNRYPEIGNSKIYEMLKSVRPEKSLFGAAVLSKFSDMESHRAILSLLRNENREVSIKRKIIEEIQIPNSNEILELYFEYLSEILQTPSPSKELASYISVLINKLAPYYSESFFTFAQNNIENLPAEVQKKVKLYIGIYSQQSSVEKEVELLSSDDKDIVFPILTNLTKSAIPEWRLIIYLHALPAFNLKFQLKIYSELEKMMPGKPSEDLVDQLFILLSSGIPEIIHRVANTIGNILNWNYNREKISSVYPHIMKFFDGMPDFRTDFLNNNEMNIKKIIEKGFLLDQELINYFFKFDNSAQYFLAYPNSEIRNNAFKKLKPKIEKGGVNGYYYVFASLDRAIRNWIPKTLISYLKNETIHQPNMKEKISILEFFVKINNNMILFELDKLIDTYKADEWLDAIISLAESFQHSISVEILIKLIRNVAERFQNSVRHIRLFKILFGLSTYWGYYLAFEVLSTQASRESELLEFISQRKSNAMLVPFHNFYKTIMNEPPNVKMIFVLNMVSQLGISVDALKNLPVFNPKDYILLLIDNNPYSKEIKLYLESVEEDHTQIIDNVIEEVTNVDKKNELLNLRARIQSKFQSKDHSDESEFLV